AGHGGAVSRPAAAVVAGVVGILAAAELDPPDCEMTSAVSPPATASRPTPIALLRMIAWRLRSRSCWARMAAIFARRACASGFLVDMWKVLPRGRFGCVQPTGRKTGWIAWQGRPRIPR